MFIDPLFTETKVRSVRRIVSWDVVARGTTPNDQAMGYGKCRNGTTPRQDDGKLIQGQQPTKPDDPPSELDKVSAWIQEADRVGMDILVSFEHSSPQGSYCYLPTRDQYRKAIRAFRDKFPQVDRYTPWNEPNHRTQPTNKRFYPGKEGSRQKYIGARQAGRYWLDMKKECLRKNYVRCSVGAGDFLDDGTFSDKSFSYSQGGNFFKNYVEGLNGQEPSVWAWHAYSAGYEGFAPPLDTERKPRNPDTGQRECEKRREKKRFVPRSSKRLQRFVEATDYVSKKPPDIWLTEQGARYDQHRNPCYDDLSEPQDAVNAANEDLKFLLTLPFKAFVKERIKRMYVYHWIADPEDRAKFHPDKQPFDAGLLEANNLEHPPRSLYYTFKNTVTGAENTATQP